MAAKTKGDGVVKQVMEHILAYEEAKGRRPAVARVSKKAMAQLKSEGRWPLEVLSVPVEVCI